MLNHSLRFILILFVGTLIGVGCKSTQKTQKASLAPTAKENTLLWSVQSSKDATPSYIYGTIHLIPKADYFVSPQLETIINEVDQVDFEVNIAEMNDPMSMMALLPKMMMPDGKTLADLISKESYDKIAKNMENTGLPLMILDKIKPIFLSVLLEQMKMEDKGAEAFVSYEMELFEQAKSIGKKTGGLETLAFQMGMLDSIPLVDQAKMLVEGFNENSETDSSLEAMINLYKKRDLIGLAEIIKSGEEIMDMNALLGDRNKNWTPIIIENLKTQSHLYAVGAGHLVGTDGVIALLRKSGMIVTPIFETLTKKQPLNKVEDRTKMEVEQILEPGTQGN